MDLDAVVLDDDAFNETLAEIHLLLASQLPQPGVERLAESVDVPSHIDQRGALLSVRRETVEPSADCLDLLVDGAAA